MAKRVPGFENAFWRGLLLKNELRIEPEHFRIRFESAFLRGAFKYVIFASDSKLHFSRGERQKRARPGSRLQRYEAKWSERAERRAPRRVEKASDVREGAERRAVQ